MATIQPSPVRNIGSRIVATWDFSAAATALVRGWSSPSLADPTGATFTINKNGAGATTITMGADTTAADIVTRINGFVSGVASASGNRVDIAASTSIVIAGVNSALFTKIGIPNVTRDRGVTAGTSIQLPIDIGGAETENVSSPIAVPVGANRVSLWVKLTAVASNAVGGDFAVAWGNGVEGETHAGIIDLPYQAVLSGTVVNSATDALLGAQKAYNGIVQQVGSSASAVVTRMYEITVPPGATKLYVIAHKARSEDTTLPPPFTPPTMSAAVYFGAR